jgi:hypothetical protein
MRAVGGKGGERSDQGTLEGDGAVLARARHPRLSQVRNIVGSVLDVIGLRPAVSQFDTILRP